MVELLLCAAWVVGMAGLGGIAVYAVLSLRDEDKAARGVQINRVKL